MGERISFTSCLPGIKEIRITVLESMQSSYVTDDWLSDNIAAIPSAGFPL